MKEFNKRSGGNKQLAFKVGIVTFLVIFMGNCRLIMEPVNEYKIQQHIRTTAASSVVGYLPGEFEVGASGSPNYSITLEVPPGINEVQPEISLSYSNSGSNGILGYGWQLNGLSLITRTGRNIPQDGITSGVTLTYNDRFAINGQRLIAYKNKQGNVLTTIEERAAAYGRDGTEYRTEVESGTRIFSFGGCGDGPCSFEAQMKDGSIINFAQTDDSRIQHKDSPAVIMWAANRVIDANKNFVEVNYYQDIADGFFIPKEINYTGNITANLSTQRRIQFEYETRPDTIFNYLVGLKFSCGQRLQSVKTFIDLDGDGLDVNNAQNLVSTYNIGFISSTSTYRSVINSIEICDASGVCLPATTMDITTINMDKPFTEMLTPLPKGFSNMLQDDVEKIRADFDGDGKVDIALMKQYDSTMPIIYSNDQGVFEIVNAQVPSGYSGYLNNPDVTTITADYNGDGKTDLFFFEEAKSTVAIIYTIGLGEFEGVTKRLPSDFNNIFNQQDVEKISGDINGDGLSDFMGFKSGYRSVPILIGQPDGEFSGLTSKLPLQVAEFFNPSGGTHIPGDFNGDGLMDVVTFNDGYQSMPAIYSDGRGGFTSSLERFPANITQLVNAVNTERITGDFNGDGIIDISLFIDGANTIPVLYSTGNGSFEDYLVPLPSKDAEYFTSPNSEKVTGDINGDDITDIMAFQVGLKSVPSMISKSQGKYFYKRIPINAALANAINAPGVERMVTDFNGDGLIDVAGIMSGFTNLPMLIASEFDDKNNKPDLIKQITDGIGKVIEINYLPLTNDSVYKDGDGLAYPYYTSQFAHFVVSDYRALESQVNPSSILSFSMSYTGAVIDNFRGFLGFQSVSSHDFQRNLVISTSYATTFPFIGMVESKIINDAKFPDKILGKEIYDYQSAPMGPTIIESLWNSEYRLDHYTNGYYNYTLQQNFTYDDQHQNLVRIDDLGDISIQGDEVFTHFNYFSYDENGKDWWKSYFPIAEKTTKINNNPDWNKWTTIDLNWEVYEYDSLMNKTFDKSYMNNDGQGGSIWVVEQMTYDLYGNQIMILYPPNQGTDNIWSRNIYDSVYHTFIVESEHSPGSPDDNSSPVLQAKFEFDPRWGVPVLEIDPNDNVLMYVPDYGLDGFGRVLITQGTRPDKKTLVTNSVGSYLEGKSGVGYFLLVQSPNSWNDGNEPQADWAFTKTYYDGMDREISTEFNGTNSGNNIIKNVEYNKEGQISRQYAPHYIQTSSDSVGYTQQSYYPHGQLKKVEIRDPNGCEEMILSEEFLYDTTNSLIVYIRKPSPVSNADDVYYKQVYDYTGNVVLNAGPYTLPGQPGEEYGETKYFYDQLKRLYQVIDPVAQPTFYYYNSTAQIIKQFQIETDTTFFVFNNRELQIQKITALGTLHWEYDDLTRLLYQSQTPTGEPTDTIASYKYDDLSISKNGLGQLSTTTTPNLQYSYSYSNTGVPYEKAALFNELNQKFIQGFAFDPLGRLYKSIYPDSSVLNYKYDFAGNYSHVIFNNDTISSYPEYNAMGQILKVQYGNQVKSEYKYDLSGRVRTSKTNKGAYFHEDLTYEWSNSNDIKSIYDNRSVKEVDQTGIYKYSQAGRLKISESAVGTEHFIYDPAGNRTSLNNEVYNYSDLKKHQLDSITRNDTTLYRYTYNTTGELKSKYVNLDNLDQDSSLSFVYQFEVDGNLKSVSLTDDESTQSSFVYNGENERIIKRDPDGVTTYYISEFYEAVRLSSGELLYSTYCFDDRGVLYASTQDSSEVQLFNGSHTESILYTGLSSGGHLLLTNIIKDILAHLDMYLFLLGLGLILIWLVNYFYDFYKNLNHRHHLKYGPGKAIGYSFTLLAGLLMVNQPLVAQSSSTFHPGVNGPGVPEAGEIRYFHQNQIGSNIMLTDDTGGLANSLLYSSFGKLDEEKSTGTNNFRGKFTGKEFDSYTGLQYFGSRYYDADIGRFISPDPAQQYFSPYLYGDNNPISGVDPDGELFFEIALIVAAIVFAYAGAALANGTLNPAEWEWDSAETWIGIISGAVTGIAVVATGGVALAYFGVVAAESLTVAGLSASTIAFTADIALTAIDVGVFASDPSLSNGIMLGIDLVAFGGALIGRFGKSSKYASKTSRGETGLSKTNKTNRSSRVDNLFETCPLSFVQGTKVSTIESTINIESIKVGDEVMSYNFDKRQYGLNAVSKVFKRVATVLVVLVVGSSDTLCVTLEHPFFTKENDWVEAQFLTAGTELQSIDDSYSVPSKFDNNYDVVTSVRVVQDTSVIVNNIEVEQAHNFLVGKERVLVHNVKCRESRLLKSQYNNLNRADKKLFRSLKRRITKYGADTGRLNRHIKRRIGRRFNNPRNSTVHPLGHDTGPHGQTLISVDFIPGGVVHYPGPFRILFYRKRSGTIKILGIGDTHQHGAPIQYPPNIP